MSGKPQFRNLPRPARIAVVLFGIGGVLGSIQAASRLDPSGSGYFALLAFLAVAMAHTKVRLAGGSSLSLLTTVALVAMMMLGTKAAVLVAVCGVVAQCAIPLRRFIPHHLVFNLGMIVLTISMAGAGYYAIVRDGHTGRTDQFVGSLVASLLYYAGNSVCVSLIVGLSSRKSPFRLWHDNFLYTAPSFVIAGVLASLTAQFVASFRATVLLIVAPVLYLCYYSYRVYLNSLENEKKHSAEMAELFDSTLSTLVLAIDAKDKNTHGHVQRVQKYSRAIAEAMRLDARQIEAIAVAALLHDIGKLAIPEYILSKPGPLTPEEMRKMRLHPQLGADIISNIKFPYPVVDSILAHHERFDGSGYPNGLSGEAIPLGARVLAVADVFDAITSDRVECRETIDASLAEIRAGAGTLFDPQIAAVWDSICRDIVMETPWHPPAAAYTKIRHATSELKILESLAQSLSNLTTVEDIASEVASLLSECIPGCAPRLKSGQHEGVPVTFDGEVIGAIVVNQSHEPLSEDEVRLVAAIADTISGALNKAQALEAARRDAAVDKLTGLSNRRALELIAGSLPDEFSIILIDVNSFKAVNDNFGHQAGDAALVRIAAHLNAAFEGARMICRLGGDEFFVLSVAERRTLRSQIRNFRRLVTSDPAHEPYRKMLFGVSCGFAAVPAEADTIEHAMERADERMYAIKTRFKRFASRAVRGGDPPVAEITSVIR